MNKEEIQNKTNNYMWEAFLLGAWYGQAEMEQHMDNEMLNVCLEHINGKKMSSPLFSKSTGKTVIYNLRSEKWRKAIFGKKEEFKKLLKEFQELIKNMN